MGQDVKMVQPERGVWTNGAGAVSIIEGAPHMNASKVYVNWLLSREVQEAWAKTTTANTRRTDVAPVSPDTFPDPKRLRDYLKIDEGFEKLRERAKKIARKVMK